MSNQIKVGDTFRVFEVVKEFDNINCLIGKTGIEIQFDNSYAPHNILLNFTEKTRWFLKSELKQVGTIRIKALKK